MKLVTHKQKHNSCVCHLNVVIYEFYIAIVYLQHISQRLYILKNSNFCFKKLHLQSFYG